MLERLDKFVISKKPYAIDRDSFEVNLASTSGASDPQLVMWKYKIQAIWFRKRSNGRLAAFSGTLSSLSTNRNGGTEWSLEDFIAKFDEARYGGDPWGCWDGKGAWWSKTAADDYELQQELLSEYKSMLENYPNIPDGYDGWYQLKENF